MYKCHICKAEREYSTKTVSVPQAANKSASSMIRFLSQRSAKVPAIKQKRMDGKKEQIDNSVMLEAVPFCSYTHTISAKFVIAVPNVDTACELHSIKKALRPENKFLFMALPLHFKDRMKNAKPDLDGK